MHENVCNTNTFVYKLGIQIRIVMHTNTRGCPRTLGCGVTTTITITTTTILLLRPLLPQLELEWTALGSGLERVEKTIIFYKRREFSYTVCSDLNDGRNDSLYFE